jgi:glycosyltransferase involved in cell wall biosynthesis
MPRLIERRPDARLVILGGETPYVRPWLIQPGRVPHETLPGVIQACEVGTAQIFSGSGTRLKILEYLAAGLPVVATTKGAEGLALEAGRDLLLAEDAERFAEAIAELLGNRERAKAFANAGAQKVREQYSWPAVIQSLAPADEPGRRDAPPRSRPARPCARQHAGDSRSVPCSDSHGTDRITPRFFSLHAEPGMSQQRRLLLIAYACHPAKGSEEGVGWGWMRMLAERNEITLLTASFNAPAVASAVSADPTLRDRVSVRAVPHRPWHYRPEGPWLAIERSGLKPLMNLAYQAWLGDAQRLAKQLANETSFDAIHLATYVGFRFPGRFDELGLPFIWGPIGGMENTPWRFLPAMGIRGATYYTFRNLINTLQKQFLPGPKRVAGADHAGLIAATKGVQREIARHYNRESELVCEIGPPPIRAEAPAQREPNEPLQLIWSGEHLPGKALPLLLKALARLPYTANWNLTILGEGPCTKRWRKMARRLGIDARCEWPGRLPRDRALRRMGRAHLLCITSMKDLTSTVLLEALSLGVPVVCPDHCGFANVVTPSCGIRLLLHRPRQLIRDLSQAIERIEADEPERRRLAHGALTRSRDFDWSRKAEQVEHLYQRILAQRTLPENTATETGSDIARHAAFAHR